MNPVYFQALFAFLVTMAITPGPNNLMLAASGASFGYRRTIPHIVGILVGMELMFILNTMGIGIVLKSVPALAIALRVAGAAYLCYLAFKLMFSKPHGDGERRGKPLTIPEAALFQWVNPKAWIITLSGVSLFVKPDGEFIPSCAALLLAFALACPACVSVWAAFGSALKAFLAKEKYGRVFNVASGALMLGAVAFAFK